MKQKKHLLPSLLVVSCLPFLTSPIWALQAVLQVLEGTVSVQHPQQLTWDVVNKEIPVTEGDRIKTEKDSLGFLTLPDDHRVAIGPLTFFTIQRMVPGKTKFYLKEGNLRNKVRKLNLGQGDFYKIQTPSAVCAVRGTDFTAAFDGAHRVMRVDMFEGEATVAASITGEVRERLVSAGQTIALERNGRFSEEHRVTPGSPGQAVPSSEKKTEKKSDDHSNAHQPPTPLGSDGTFRQDDWYDWMKKNPEKAKEIMKNPDTFFNMTPQEFVPEKRPDSEGWDKNHRWENFDQATNNYGEYRNVNSQNTGQYSNGGNTSIPGGNTSTQVGNQALLDTVRSYTQAAALQGLLVQQLYNDGDVKLGPDGVFHQYADAVVQTGSKSIRFLNATMVSGQPSTLNYQTTDITFNTAYTNYLTATQTAFHASGSTSPTFYATDMETYRSNTVDYVDVIGSGGVPVADTGGTSYTTNFGSIKTTLNGTQLWTKNGTSYTYLGGTAPTRTLSTTSQADYGASDTYSTGSYLGRHVTYSDDNGKTASQGSVPSGTGALSYLQGLYVQDTLYSNLFLKGSIVSFGSALSRIYGGVDYCSSNSDALSILGGSKVIGAPDGLVQ